MVFSFAPPPSILKICRGPVDGFYHMINYVCNCQLSFNRDRNVVDFFSFEMTNITKSNNISLHIHLQWGIPFFIHLMPILKHINPKSDKLKYRATVCLKTLVIIGGVGLYSLVRISPGWGKHLGKNCSWVAGIKPAILVVLAQCLNPRCHATPPSITHLKCTI